MRVSRRIAFAVCIAVILISASPRPIAIAQANSGESSNTIACSVLEVHSLAQPAVTVVVFHQRDKADQERLGDLLRRRSNSSVEFQTTDGAWHSATVVRLKSCFGRGLLIFPAGTVHLEEKDSYLLKFSSD
jgi:hypothetical protein